MLRVLLFSAVLLLTAACGRDADIVPTLAAEVAGHYQTNGYLDYLCLALPPDKMPSVTLSEAPGSTLTLTYRQQYPAARTLTLPQVQLQRLADNSIELRQQGAIIGTVRTDRAFTRNGLERQALVLRLLQATNADTISFTGSK